MEPDGYVWITVRDWPWDDGVSEDMVIRWDFKDIVWWRRDEYGIMARLETRDFILLPWDNILNVEWKTNSDEYVKWYRENAGSLPPGKIDVCAECDTKRMKTP